MITQNAGQGPQVNLAKLKSLRIQRGLSQAQLSSMLGYSADNGYTRIETGEVRPRADQLYIIAKTLGVRMEDLIDDGTEGGDA